ncbi:MAG: hypothetical protein MRERV_19c008 [Mycoplasmataceae bacterium RV_VA103A]|nr:MAG: hypothetical protein MRERV_19c008 [Mycoplasmataceae bacterium RV_VA103A]
MSELNFYFKAKKVVLNEEERVMRVELNDFGQGLLFSPQEFQETRFHTLILSATPQVRKTLLENYVNDKRIVIKDIQKEPTLASIDEKTISLMAGNFGAVEIVNEENENPFDPVKIDWDKFNGGWKKQKGWKSWRMWWNPYDMKFWNPPLTLDEQEKWLNGRDKESSDYYEAWKVYKNRLNKQNRQIDLYFQANTTDKSHSISGSWCNEYRDQWVIKIFSWPPFAPPPEISELIPDSPRLEEFANIVIGRIDLVFDNQDPKNMELFHQWDSLLKEAPPKQKFVIHNIPLQIRESWYALDNFHDFHKLDWQNLHQKGDEEPQWEETNNADFMRKAIYKDKKVKAIQIGTKGLEEQLKLEKVLTKETDWEKGRTQHPNNFDLTPWLIGGGVAILLVIFAFSCWRRRKARKIRLLKISNYQKNN